MGKLVQHHIATEMCTKFDHTNDESNALQEAGYKYVEGTPIPQPIGRPTFTLMELKNAIPPHCFERSMVKSLGYLMGDILTIALLLCCSYFILEHQFVPPSFTVIAYPVYWLIQGSFLFGLWVLAHECGELSILHRAFIVSSYDNMLLN